MAGVKLSAAAVAYLLHHVALLPNPPQTNDSTSQAETKLFQFVKSCMADFSKQFPDDISQDFFATIRATLANFSDFRDDEGCIDPKQLEKAFRHLTTTPDAIAIPIEVKAQNAGIIVRREGSNIIFESFELAPTNAQVYSAQGRLARSFPACAVAITLQRFENDGLQNSLARTIANMSSQSASEFQPKIAKAGQEHDEQRDTTKPDVVTSLLMSVLAAVGTPVKTLSLWKNTREDIYWSSSFMPWRRSSVWLLLRVTLQLRLQNVPTTLAGQDLYKAFMIFFMSRLLDAAYEHHVSLGSEPGYALSMKLLRRIKKMEARELLDPVRHEWLRIAKVSIFKTSALLKDTWVKIQGRDSFPMGASLQQLRSIQPASDLTMTLSELDKFLLGRFDSHAQPTVSEFRPQSTKFTFSAHELPTEFQSKGTESFHELIEFESWVEHYLDTWSEYHKDELATPKKLYSTMQEYFTTASSVYTGNASAFSTMFLTTMELWIACDRSARHLTPLMSEYDPEVPLPLLQSLLLPRKSQLERLFKIEAYVVTRQNKASLSAGLIFHQFGHPDSFAVKYFDQSASHQTLLRRIEAKAELDKEEKTKELRSSQDQYAELMRKHDLAACEYHYVVDHQGYQNRQHSVSCKKCSYKKEAGSINIDIHEWPLPQDVSGAKAVVFEIAIPEAFTAWRDASCFVMNTVLGSEYVKREEPNYYHPVSYDEGVSNFRISTGLRILPLSRVKPHMKTHRRTKSVVPALTPDDICLNNGLRYQYFDTSKNHFTSAFSQTDLVPGQCIHRLPSRSTQLQRFLMRPAWRANGTTPNEVISNQSECPTHMSLDEYKAFASLPLGENIQYLNILVQLSNPSISLIKAETHVLILQLIHQAGSPAESRSNERRAHEILTDKPFSQQFLSHISASLAQFTENWESWRALAICAQLILRLLTLTPHPDITIQCERDLAKIRRICLDWIETIEVRIQSSVDDSQRAELTSRAVEIALVGVCTFDTDVEQLAQTLGNPEASSILIRCSIAISDSINSEQSEHRLLHQIMIQNWRSLAQRALPILSTEVVRKHGACLDNAIKHLWATYQPVPGNWEQLTAPQDQWLVNRSSKASSSLTVHYNLLTAELLVNGLPLARLPRQYTEHPIYSVLFGNAMMDVAPTDITGFQLCSKHTFRGYQLLFGWQQPHLLVRAIKDKRVFDLVPSAVLADNFPEMFLTSFIHWYDHVHKAIVFSARDDPWSLDATTGWQLTNVMDHWQMINDVSALVNVKSNTARNMAHIFSPIEDKDQLHVIWNQLSRELSIDLPKLRLGFYVDSDRSCVRSRQYRGMVIDSDQSIGTLTGLKTKIVLKADHKNFAKNRMVLIPSGSVCFRKEGDHVRVTTQKGATKAHAFSVDNVLGRLLDDGSLQSKLFLCYLHALTSHCLPDPLISQSGTEQALTILQSAAVRSFDYLPYESASILELIAKLAPRRAFYPRNLKVMQTVRWNQELGFLAQHSSFHVLVKNVFDQAHRNNLFHPNVKLTLPQIDFIEPNLLERDLIRTSTFRIATFGAEQFTTKCDRTYGARDKGQELDRSRRSYLAAVLIDRDSTALCKALSPGLSQTMRVYLGKAIITGPDKALAPPELQYSPVLLSKAPTSLVREAWLRLHLSFRHSSYHYNRFDIMTWLATLAFVKDADMDIIQGIATMYRLSQLASVSIPRRLTFELEHGDRPQLQMMRDLYTEKGCRSFSGSTEANLPRSGNESDWQWRLRIQERFRNAQKEAISRLTLTLYNQWPREQPTVPTDPDIVTYVNTTVVTADIKAMFSACYHNRQLYEYFDAIVAAIQQQPVISAALPRYAISSTRPDLSIVSQSIQLEGSFLSDLSPLPDPPSEPWKLGKRTSDGPPVTASIGPLEAFCEQIRRHSKSEEERTYVTDLRKSSSALTKNEEQDIIVPSASDIQHYLLECRKYLDDITSLLAAATGTASLSSTIAKHAQLSTRVSPNFLLSRLNLENWATLSENWKKAIVNYGLAVTNYRRAQRLSTLPGDSLDLKSELQNRGHTNWDPLDDPEALLLEAESGITIREVQAEIARQMREPPVDNNAVMQLNMGEGKSSVIIPWVAAFLASGKKLVRAIVAKAQSKQMLEMLVSKVGGLLNRRIYHMPFSRALKVDIVLARKIREIFDECISNRGILLLQPEHILSFKLMGIECLLSGRDDVGRNLLDAQHFLETHSRDLVDESDENFNPKFELVYTMGTQQPVQLSPERWTVVHHVLSLVQRFALDVKHDLPDAIEVENNSAKRFPRIRILQEDAQVKLLDQVVAHICNVGMPHFPLARQTQPVRDSVRRYITDSELHRTDVSAVESGNFWNDSIKDLLLLLRGLIAGGVLGFTLSSKRWRVNYGLDEGRSPPTKLAVPYRSKDNPSLRSEFSHPDVVIVLTTLTYYYGGLTNDDLFDTLDHLVKSDQADIEYVEWAKTAEALPEAFRQLSGVNIKDRFQCVQDLFPCLKYSKGAIDYFLAHIVFPKAMKEFPQKLSASGWDLGMKKSHPTTGFSGTNDSRHVLPLSVAHLDLPNQRHTNALVLSYLLQEENLVHILPQRLGKTTSDAQHILDVVTSMDQRTRVILDVGAQILEMNNYQVASTWLHMLSDDAAKAVVYFNDDEQISVLDRTGRIEALQTSPFVQQLDACLIYLDEAHTRGTDLKLPRDYRAAVTLGAKITKDRLVQACMRMRKLGKGQSVIFLVPHEIENKINVQRQKPRTSSITVSDVLCWAITETWADLRSLLPLWAVQGRRFEDHKHILNGSKTHIKQAQGFLEDEAQTLDQRYRPRSHLEGSGFSLSKWNTSNPQISRMISRCRDFGSMSFDSATLQEEQERELSPEIEQERQVERPAPMKAEKHMIHPDVHTLINEGRLIDHSPAFIPAFSSLKTTTAAEHFDICQFPDDVLVTVDFARTVKQPSSVVGSTFVSDSYQRPVQWIISVPTVSGKIEELVVITPFEANQLLPTIRKTQKVTLHVYLPRLNVGYKPLDALDLYTVGRVFSPKSVPRSLTVSLNLFAGQLYLRSYAEYLELCEFLGLASHAAKDGEMVRADGFIENSIGRWGFRASPVEFLRLLVLKIRRDCEGGEKTHIGKVLNGDLLEEGAFSS